ncbi:hypothetical protein [Ruegeria profundi]|uniref:Uncharacterized protein n=1 Tax=Ruegeria profundi TaxID=1685378 RepID=A0A0X3TBM4_9RHOB|nr:hypothetical protein [Ruegeria profundi]KUJ73138.1 hypothetical protein AVO44_20260 [Ruegeria profundi]
MGTNLPSASYRLQATTMERDCQVPVCVRILASRHQAEETESFNPRDDGCVFAGYRQFNALFAFLH